MPERRWTIAARFALLSRAVPLGAVLMAGGCGGTEASGVYADWEAETERRGDTLVVRTIDGSVWRDTMRLVPELAIGVLEGDPAYIFGNIRAVDVDAGGRIVVTEAQARQIRIFDPDGRHVLSFGREGDGPGEFRFPGSLRVLPDGRIVVRDAGRFAVFSPDGEFLDSWPLLSGYATSRPFFFDAQGRVINPTFQTSLVRYELDGTALDTTAIPTTGLEPQQVRVPMPNGRSVAVFSVPFTPTEEWAGGIDGQIFFGVTNEYAIDRRSEDGSVLRIEREAELVPVLADESEQARRSVEGIAAVPGTKPFFKALYVGRDGSIWLLRHTRAEEVENPRWDANDPRSGSPTYWVEPSVADVFDPDGRYLGAVLLPERFDIRDAALTADRVWAMAEHELGYPQVVRFRIEPVGNQGPSAEPEAS